MKIISKFTLSHFARMSRMQHKYQ